MDTPVLDALERVGKKIYDESTEHERLVAELCEKHQQPGLYQELDKALDRNDLECIHLLLDAIEAWWASQNMFNSLPQFIQLRLLEELKGEPQDASSQSQDNTRDQDTTKG